MMVYPPGRKAPTEAETGTADGAGGRQEGGPFTLFLSECIFQGERGKKRGQKDVHECDWRGRKWNFLLCEIVKKKKNI